MNKVKLSDNIDAIDFHCEESESYIDKRTNTVCTISDEHISIAEEERDYPDWMEDDIKNAKAYLKDDSQFIVLPSQDDVDEFGMMEEFASSLEDEHSKDKLFIALSGKGSFRRFKDTVNMLDIADDWYKFKNEQYKNFVLEWCEMERIELAEE